MENREMSQVLIAMGAMAGWIGCGLLSGGFYYAHFQRKYPMLADADRSDDAAKAWIQLIGGPISLAATIACGMFTRGWVLPGRDPFR
jgi:hypothetical protein